jgi:hypothetical protein
MSRVQIKGREDFETLVRKARRGRFARCLRWKVSHLARSNLGWHRLLELCPLSETLVIDEDRCYNPPISTMAVLGIPEPIVGPASDLPAKILHH